MQTWTFDSPDPERTREMGAALGRSIGREGLVLALVGPLGAGKTVFVKGLAEGLGVDPRIVSSPTFVIAQEYPLPSYSMGDGKGEAGDAAVGPTTLHHIDLYRLESEDELEAIGFFDMLAPGNVLAVEWADRFQGVLGRKVLTIELEGPSASKADAEAGTGREASSAPVRTARLTAAGEAAERVLQDFAARAEATPAGAISAGGRSAGAGRSASPEMRLMHMLCLCLIGLASLGLGSARFDAFAEPLGLETTARTAGCGPGRDWVAVEADALGTLRATCADDGRPGEGQGALFGIGRLVSGERIDLSRASSALLQTLPGIGPARAESILAHRKLGVLLVARDLERVPGIGPKTRSRLERWVETQSSGPERNGG